MQNGMLISWNNGQNRLFVAWGQSLFVTHEEGFKMRIQVATYGNPLVATLDPRAKAFPPGGVTLDDTIRTISTAIMDAYCSQEESLDLDPLIPQRD